MNIQHDPNGYLYMASPYTHTDEAVRQWRYEQALRAVALLQNERIWTYSPIVHTHPLCLLGAPVEFAHYETWDKVMIAQSCGVLVLQVEGWEASAGIQHELQYALEIHKSIQYMGGLYHMEALQGHD